MWSASNLQPMSFKPQPHLCNDISSLIKGPSFILQPFWSLKGCTEFRQRMIFAWSRINRVEISHCLTSQTRNFTPFRQASHSLLRGRCQVTSEDSGGTLSGESILQNEETLARDLKTAIKEENYAQAAKIRDSLRLLQENSKASVLAANARFYNAFKTGDLASMQALWSRGENTCIVHPGVSGISGYDLIMGSWEFVWAEYEFPLEIEIRDVQVHVRGDLGYVTCVEMVKTKGSSWGKQFATNVFEKVDGQWFICIHHASYIDL
ncbi:uncharacterized protein LOC132630596 isoform X1 [Lycium barbarum]|uniref:uncharacterized protein LOC132630596 isoform X1 n=1 Tax=Lycium barbarum TaxID=112863 RepID=UPI00293F4AAE|nr:uncharacterized protein LOC132630596 isoform X1 [Lycium barbarum]